MIKILVNKVRLKLHLFIVNDFSSQLDSAAKKRSSLSTERTLTF